MISKIIAYGILGLLVAGFIAQAVMLPDGLTSLLISVVISLLATWALNKVLA